MRSALRAAAVIAAATPFLILASPATAQSVAGVWETEMPTRMEVRGGEHVGTNPVRITITLTQTGDSVTGTWERAPLEGLPAAPARKLTGVIKGAHLTLQSEPTKAKIKRGEEEAYDIEMVTTYVLSVASDALTGTESSTSTDGSIQAPERAFNAKRVKS